MARLLLLLGWFSPVDYTPQVAVEIAYALVTPQEYSPPECCGLCVNGVITHGDGHKTKCACPSTCKCKTQNK